MVRGAVGAALVGTVLAFAAGRVAAAGDVDTGLIVEDFPGYVHEASSIDGPIDGGTLLEFGGETVDGSAADYAEKLKGRGRSWRAADGGAYALVWLLDCGDEETAAQFLDGMSSRASDAENGSFDPGLAGATGWSGRESGAYVHSVFWRQGSYVVDITIASGDRARSREDTTALARLEADTLQMAIGGTRTTEAPSASGDEGSAEYSIARALGSLTGMALLGWGIVAAVRASNRRRAPRPLGPPLPPAPLPPMASSLPPPLVPAPLVPAPPTSSDRLWVIPE
jgi:hypothetical protein